ncbi:MAG: carbohydrate ABC transporter permease, partial [Candidatus Bathyarchaeia archaeon]
PIFIMIRQAQLIDTYIGYILPLAAFFAPFVAWMMIGFFENIPIELEEQGLVDGCTRFQAFLRVTLPLAAPGLVSSAVWSFLSTWGELMFALVLTGANVNPLTVVIALGIGEVQARYGFMCAQAVIALAPPLIMAVVLQKYIVKGLTAGAIKG